MPTKTPFAIASLVSRVTTRRPRLSSKTTGAVTSVSSCAAFPNNSPALANPKDDQKLASAEVILEDWLSNGFNPVVFCRYIATANYVGEQLGAGAQEEIPETRPPGHHE